MTLDLDGAVPAGVPDAKTMLASGPTDACGPALHYGDPSAEYRALDGGRAFVDLSDWDVVRVSGPDRLGWLNSLTSQRMIGLRAGDSTETLLLGPSGHVENAAFAVEDGEATWLVTDPGHGAGWVDFLDSMRFTMRVEVAIREDLAAIGGLGRHAADGLVRSAIDRGAQPSDAWREIAYAETVPLIWTDPWPGPAAGGATYTPPGLAHPAEGWGRFVVLVERRDLNEAVARLADAGYTPAGALAWEAARLAAWRPQAKDVEAKSLPHEFDWLRTAVHLDKGCYRGQETVAKLVNLGRPPRRLVELYLEGSLDALPAPGTAVEVDGRVAGTVLASVRHPEDGPIALALIRRAVAVDAVVDVGGFTAGQEAIVDPGGKSSASPAERPGAEFRGSRRLAGGGSHGGGASGAAGGADRPSAARRVGSLDGETSYDGAEASPRHGGTEASPDGDGMEASPDYDGGK